MTAAANPDRDVKAPVGAAEAPPTSRIRQWAQRVSLNRKLAYVLLGAAITSGLATVGTMTGSSSPDPKTVLTLLSLDIVLLLLLGALVAWRLATMWLERRKGQAGSGLLVRLVVLFSVVAVTPAILVALFSGVFLNFGLRAWFSEPVRTALESSQVVARAYLREHKQNIVSRIFVVANDLNQNAPALARDRRRFDRYLTAQSELRAIPEIVVVDSNGQVLARSELSLSLEFDLVPPSALEKAKRGKIVVLTTESDDRVRAVVKLNRFVDAYLLVGQYVDPRVLSHIEAAGKGVLRYKRLEEKREGFQISFIMMYVVVAVLLLLAAVWVGMALATQMTRPISNLIAAAERVRKGDLGVRVDNPETADEIGSLSRAFNRMTTQIETQQQGLMEANRQLDERRRFTETVLSGVSAGVIGLDSEGRINLPNRSASELLGTDLEQAIGRDLTQVVPEMGELVQGVMADPSRLQQAEIKLVRRGNMRILLVRVATERVGGDIVGYVVTFDDVTELLSAQRKAAWADVARRIAHEMKNPLTPIQLSAERLKRKYLKEIKSDPETFSTCTETIVRQVEDIGRMVDEFSAFARMPQPVMRRENLSDVCRQAIFLERNRHRDIVFDVELPDEDVVLTCDKRQIGQALTNVLKNAAEAITERRSGGQEKPPPGRIKLALAETHGDSDRRVIITIEDNGKGFPAKDRDRLTEPYVTSRTKGTGLGLAIVRKIMEDHGAKLVLADREEGGARVSLVFRPVGDEAAGAEEEEATEREARGASAATNVAAHGS